MAGRLSGNTYCKRPLNNRLMKQADTMQKPTSTLNVAPQYLMISLTGHSVIAAKLKIALSLRCSTLLKPQVRLKRLSARRQVSLP